MYFNIRNSKVLEKNLTAVIEIFLLGFQVSHDLRIFLFCLLLVLYFGTLCGNLLIIMLVITSKNLHTPMYLFISQLSISDILVITDIVPKMLYVLLNNGGTITFISCITQFYFLGASETVECFLLAVMSYDRYVAICNPLHYNVIMKNGFCVILTLICWVLGFSIVLIYMITTAKLSFCGPNVIDHIFCDIVPLLELSCSDAYIVHLEVYFLSIPIVFIPITIIVGSYINIVVSVLKIPSSIGRHKAFSTCSSHLTVVSIFFWTIFSIYVVPTNGQSSTISKILSLLYTVFTPFVNPIIYSLRNYDFIKAIQKSCYKNLSCSDTTIIDIQGLILGFLVVAVPFIIIAMSYVYIVITILKIPSTTGRHKAFSTCSSHLTVVSIFYGTLFIVYMFPTKGQSLVLNKVLYLINSGTEICQEQDKYSSKSKVDQIREPFN
ncbi:olfactory receptor 1500-like [Anomaloglossus baeobatrachus]|uniref:olfactory receptor 1500-like n=1 Tax=Anomaloglossus baeobatrachus TaxID=238106 RepID=UPI003F4F9AE8